MENKKNYYRFIDILRVYCAFLIVFIHMGIGNQNAFIACVTRQGVPFFFLVSGFFFSKTLQRSQNIRQDTLRYVKGILTVYFIWVLFWLPSMLAEYSRLYEDSAVYLTAILLRRFLFAGIAPYWYLLVLAESALVLAWIDKHAFRYLGWALCAVGLILNAAYHLEEAFYTDGLIYRSFYTLFSWNNNVVMSGFPLMFLGAAANQHEARLRRLRFPVLLGLYLLAVASAFAVFYGLGYAYVFPFAIFQAVLLFLMGLSAAPFQEALSDKACRFARNYSSVLFLTHTVFLTILGNVFMLWNQGLRFILTDIGALLTLLLAGWLNWPPLNKLLMIKSPHRPQKASAPR